MLDFKKIAPIHNEVFGLKYTGEMLYMIENEQEIQDHYSSFLLTDELSFTLMNHYLNRHPAFSFGELLNSLEFELLSMIDAISQIETAPADPEAEIIQPDESFEEYADRIKQAELNAKEAGKIALERLEDQKGENTTN